MSNWESLFGNIASNEQLARKSDTYFWGITSDDLPYVIVFGFIALHFFTNDSIFGLYVGQAQYVIGGIFGLIAFGFAKLDFKIRMELWFNFVLTEGEYDLFSPEMDWILPIVEFHDDMILTSGSIFKEPAAIGGLKVYVRESFSELSRGEQQLRMNKLVELANILTTSFMTRIKTKPLDMTPLTDANEEKALLIQNNPGLQYYNFFKNADIKIKQKHNSVNNQEIYWFMEVKALYIPGEDRFMNFLKGKHINSYHAKEDRVSELEQLKTVFYQLASNMGFIVENLEKNELREYFMEHTSINKEVSFDRQVTLPDDFYRRVKQ